MLSRIGLAFILDFCWSCIWCVILLLFLRCVQSIINMLATVVSLPNWIYVACLDLKGKIKVTFIQKCYGVQVCLSTQSLCVVVL